MMKSNYIAIITAELQKLTEDQLYKVLVLVKNATDEQKIPTPRRFPNNKALFSGKNAGVFLGDEEAHEVGVIKKMVADLGMTGGYGIICVTDSSTDGRNDASGFIGFCIPDKMDAMIEVYKENHHFVYKLSVRPVGQEECNRVKFFGRTELSSALTNLTKTYQVKS
jgi:hypothetical protein